MPTRAQVAAGLRPHRMRGMTLIELMVVVAIVAILASLAVGSYRRYVLRANRTDATSALLRIQVGEEKYFLQNNAYTINATAQPPTGLGVASPLRTASITLRSLRARPAASRPPFRRPPPLRARRRRILRARP